MKSLILIGVLCSAAALGGDPIYAAEGKGATQDSDLVKAANDAKAKRGATKPKVITNADVKKSKGKIVTTTLTPLPADEAKPGPKLTSDQFYRARREATDRVTASEKKVGELDKSLDLIEQSFYAENNPNYRDDVIQKRFEQTKRQLADARKELADARDTLAGLEGRTPPSTPAAQPR
jgi:hypothetical protein